MNSYPNYNFQYPYGQVQYWMHPYYSMGYCQNNLGYYNTLQFTPQYTHHHFGGYPTSDHSVYQKKTGKQIVKLEEDSQAADNLDSQKQSSRPKVPPKIPKRRGFLPKLSEVDKDIYVHPQKKVDHKIRYFDPSSAPVVSSAAYNMVDDLQKELERCKQIQDLNVQNPNEILFPEQDNLPFIVFRHRRIKKKFKKYIKPKDQYFQGQRDPNEQSVNNCNQSSSLSQDDYSDDSYSENDDKGYKRRRNTVKRSLKQKPKQQRNFQILNISSNDNKNP